jgi:aspartyl-tRNA synthetase
MSAEQTEALGIRWHDEVLIMPRWPANPPHGITKLGRLRLKTADFLESRKLLEKDPNHKFLWVTDFPLFLTDEYDPTDPEQLRNPPLVSVHHPFTAPKTAEDVDLLATNPRAAKAAHYDLVVNGIELGGGSRRIHNRGMQEYILRNVLRLSQARCQDFSHLMKVLESGCPPHAGFALGFDRLVAVMGGFKSVREVMAFPKSGSGEDPLVGSPGELTEEQLKTYHLKLRGD